MATLDLDSLTSVSPVIATFVRDWDNVLDDDSRDRLLRPYVPRLAGTAADGDVEKRRAWMCFDWLVRVHVPAWLRLVGLDHEAEALEAMPALTTRRDVEAALSTIDAGEVAAEAAAEAVTGIPDDPGLGAEAEAFVDASAGAAATASILLAPGAAEGIGALDTAGHAARIAKVNSARDAARDALAGTVTELQHSALALLDRMIALHHEPIGVPRAEEGERPMKGDDMARLDLDSLILLKGTHDSRDDGVSLLEAVAWWAGEEHTAEPASVSPVIATFGQVWNDELDDDLRNLLLKPYVPRLAETRNGVEVEERRAWMCVDWLVRTFAPAWLRLAGLVEDADALATLPELTSSATAEAALATIRSGRAQAAAAWNVAELAAADDARDGAEVVAWHAAGQAAGPAAWVATGHAASPVVGDDAWEAAELAARVAVWDAAEDDAANADWDALTATVSALQDSALALLDRMIEVHHEPMGTTGGSTPFRGTKESEVANDDGEARSARGEDDSCDDEWRVPGVEPGSPADSGHWVIARIAEQAERQSVSVPPTALRMLTRDWNSIPPSEEIGGALVRLNNTSVVLIRDAIEEDKRSGAVCERVRRGLRIPSEWTRHYLNIYESELQWGISIVLQNALLENRLGGERRKWRSR